MILTRIQGGLGNQMFQWAYSRNLSLLYKKKLVYEDSFYSQQGEVVRNFELSSFNIPLNILTPDAIREFQSKKIQNINDDNTFKEITLFDDINYYLNGYWQSEKYFKENEAQIKKDFSYTTDRMNDLIEKYDFENNSIVSIHIRRGDYVSGSDMYPLQSIEYYKNGLEIIGDYDSILVFSDDIDWCKNNLPFEKMLFSENLSNVEDLTLMSKCKHNIIANSSFSWWGAYLNTNLHKKIVAPKNWYGPKMNIETKDLLPESWIKI
jgi:hypothetical protein